eukprot:TRINITY_DN7383_c0_g1_i1.p1 TRINITY_DN7383_c0_g1~~TRINITY_DN7383_c0_g1_i1.p1  ORF type:complete len:317 (-),score=73.49 TRINITY_DN7383_c0_g1_i1:177-1076(-)
MSMSGFKRGTYLENYLESVSTLPADLRRNFALMRELDLRSEEILEKIQKHLNSDTGNNGYYGNLNQLFSTLSGEEVDETRADFKQSLEYADEKVALALQTYELVDKHIRRLDSDLKKFEAELEQQGANLSMNGAEPQPVKGKGQKSAAASASLTSASPASRSHTASLAPPSTLNASTEISAPKGPRKKSEKAAENANQAGSAAVASSPSAGAGTGAVGSMAQSLKDARVLNVDLDMPIDPNEPTYCICSRVSFGEMVGCDNQECKIEWFHFECVGLTHPPKGKWFCPDCRAIQRKRNLM